ncbi:hypothetical protein [Halomonas sp. 328]|nr:hypothetical protein [Halomonas sp. 328]
MRRGACSSSLLRLSVYAGGFRARHMPLWQVVFSRERLGRYDAPR